MGLVNKKTEPGYIGQCNNSYTIYIGGVYEVNKDSGSNMTGSTTYYPAEDAMRVNGRLYYVLRDQLSSASEVLDSSGAVVGEQRYYPFGEVRVSTGSICTDRLYTGQRAIPSLGLMDYHARFYDSYLNRWTQPDSIIPNEYDPQSLNRYEYARNNPINFNDPSGHTACSDIPNEQAQAYCISQGGLPGFGDDTTILNQNLLTQKGNDAYKYYQTVAAQKGNHYIIDDFMANIWGYEADVLAQNPKYYAEGFQSFMEALVRSAYGYCSELTRKTGMACDATTSEGQLNYLAIQSQSLWRHVAAGPDSMDSIPDAQLDAGNQIVQAIGNPASIGHSNWSEGWAADRPYSVGNESMLPLDGLSQQQIQGIVDMHYYVYRVPGKDPAYIFNGCQFWYLNSQTDPNMWQIYVQYYGCKAP